MKEKIFINARIIDPSQKMDEKGSLILSNSSIPTIKLAKKDVHNELNIVELVILSKLEKSKSEIKN